MAVDAQDPADNALAVTKSDTDVFPIPSRAIWVGGAGDITVRMFSGQNDETWTIPAGGLLPIRVDKVYSTGTTATQIKRLW